MTLTGTIGAPGEANFAENGACDYLSTLLQVAYSESSGLRFLLQPVRDAQPLDLPGIAPYELGDGAFQHTI
jgi:hypothetical protein